MASINKRKGVITGTDAIEDYSTIYCDVSMLFACLFSSFNTISRNGKSNLLSVNVCMYVCIYSYYRVHFSFYASIDNGCNFYNKII